MSKKCGELVKTRIHRMEWRKLSLNRLFLGNYPCSLLPQLSYTTFSMKSKDQLICLNIGCNTKSEENASFETLVFLFRRVIGLWCNECFCISSGINFDDGVF